MSEALRPSVAAAGIGVSDLERSLDFYTRVLGLRKLYDLRLPHMDEAILGYGRRSAAVVLMHWTDGSTPTYQGNPVKLVFNVADPVAVADAIRAEGLAVTREPTPVPELGGAVVGLAEDPDGYVIELLQAGA